MKDTLLVYRGGGYDGCIWEFNAALWDKHGKFHDIHSSGYAGLFRYRGSDHSCVTATDDAEQAALKLIELNGHDTDTFDLTDEKEVTDFNKTYAVNFVHGCVCC